MPSDPFASAPLLDGPDAELGLAPELHPSAPPDALSPQELQQLLQALPAGSASLPTEQALRSFRTATAGKVVWTEQMREIAATADGGSYFIREAYERQLILDPEALTTADGPWAQAVPSAPPMEPSAHAAQALLAQLTVLRYDGRAAVVAVSAEHSWLGVGHQAASRFGDEVFDPERNVLLGVGPVGLGVAKGQTVKLTGLTEQPELNGRVGRVVAVGAKVQVALPQGVQSFAADHVVPHHVTVVCRSEAFELDLKQMAQSSMVLRVLWLEKSPADASPGDSSPERLLRGPMSSIGAQYVGMSARKQSMVSLGEFRNFLWNLHLEDADFALVSKRFAPSGHYIDYQEVLFLLGRPHLRSKEVPVDALIYESVVSILGRRTTSHIDRDLGDEDRGIGKRNACREHCGSYTVSIILEAVIWVNLLGLLLLTVLGWDSDLEIRLGPESFLPAGIAYLIYIIQVACFVRLTRAFHNQTQGMQEVIELMEKPRREELEFRWHVQCYHYVTRTETRRDANGNMQTTTRRERVNTHSATMCGILPSQDLTEDFVPNTLAAQSQIVTKLELDLCQSNYISEYHRWKNFHRRDIHQDSSRKEDMRSRASACLAIWSQRNMPCWMNSGCYWIANLFAMSFIYRLMAQARIGSQEYVYLRRCFNIETRRCGLSTWF